MSSSAVQPTNVSSARSRALYVLVVACFPVLLAGFISMIVFATGAVQRDDGIGHNTEFVQFNYPVPGEVVSDRFELQGTIKSVPAGEVVYLAEQADGKYWPKRRLGSSAISFKSEHYAKPGAGYKYTIVALSVGPDGESQIEAWFNNGQTTGKYPGIARVEQSTPLAKVRIIHQ